jgi:bacteriocin-like protein
MKKLALNTRTIEVLNDKALENVQGGKAPLADSCLLLSCNRKKDKSETEEVSE